MSTINNIAVVEGMVRIMNPNSRARPVQEDLLGEHSAMASGSASHAKDMSRRTKHTVPEQRDADMNAIMMLRSRPVSSREGDHSSPPSTPMRQNDEVRPLSPSCGTRKSPSVPKCRRKSPTTSAARVHVQVLRYSYISVLNLCCAIVK